MSREVFQVYLEQNTLTSEETITILDKLNSLNSAAEIKKALSTYTGQRIFGDRIAQRLFDTKVHINKFRSLNQIATVPGIGRKRFKAILSILAD